MPTLLMVSHFARSYFWTSPYGTSELMSLYYKRLRNGEGRSETLRQVQLEMMQAPAYQHPYYWASFIFSGDWSSVKAW